MPTWIPKMPTLVPWLLSWAQLGTGACGSNRSHMRALSWNLARCKLRSYSPLGQLPAHSPPPSVILELKWQVFYSKQSVLLLPVPWPVPGYKGGDRRLRNQGLFQPHSRISLATQTSEVPLLSLLEKFRLLLLLLEGQHLEVLQARIYSPFWLLTA